MKKSVRTVRDYAALRRSRLINGLASDSTGTGRSARLMTLTEAGRVVALRCQIPMLGRYLAMPNSCSIGNATFSRKSSNLVVRCLITMRVIPL
jgi:hypothetical protein